MKFYNGVQYKTFVEVCHARGIASNHNEWRQALDEANNFRMPKQMRELFALALWNEFREDMSEDFLRDFNQDTAFNRSLLEIEEILLCHNLTCVELGLPPPNVLPDLQADSLDVYDEEFLYEELYNAANQEQRDIINRVILVPS